MRWRRRRVRRRGTCRAVIRIRRADGFAALGAAVGRLVERKNRAYGDAFDVAGDAMRLLYPSGISPAQYGEALALVRVFDKMKRIATDRDAFGEDPWQDVAGYALLAMRRRRWRRRGGA